MNEQHAQEIAYRRLACQLFDKGKSATQILRQIPRSRSWLCKWKPRFADGGCGGVGEWLHSAQNLAAKVSPGGAPAGLARAPPAKSKGRMVGSARGSWSCPATAWSRSSLLSRPAIGGCGPRGSFPALPPQGAQPPIRRCSVPRGCWWPRVIGWPGRWRAARRSFAFTRWSLAATP